MDTIDRRLLAIEKGLVLARVRLTRKSAPPRKTTISKIRRSIRSMMARTAMMIRGTMRATQVPVRKRMTSLKPSSDDEQAVALAERRVPVKVTSKTSKVKSKGMPKAVNQHANSKGDAA